MSEPISIAIMAGGQSSRMGRNKAFVDVGGKPIIERIVERVSNLGSELMLVTATPEEYAHLGLSIVHDLYPGKGPLGGIYTALTRAKNEHMLAVSCDQPFLNPNFLQYLISLREGFDVIVPLSRDGYPQGMQAIYGKGCLAPIRKRLDEDRLKVIGFFPDVRVREVSGDEIDRFDADRVGFMNVNTPDDLQEAQRLAAKHDAL
jgi:molybdenum cofactor guanylyltransferase